MHTIALTDSAHIDALPEIHNPTNSVTMTPGLYSSWSAMLAANSSVDDFVLTEGDYRHWGRLNLSGVSGTLERRKVLRYVDATTHPINRVEQAVIEYIDVGAGEPCHNWVFHGLTFAASSLNHHAAIQVESSNIVWSDNLHSSYETYGLRIRRGAKNCTVQRCVFRHPIRDACHDDVGVQIQLMHHDTIDGNMNGIRILDNEFRNCGDGVQVTDDAGTPALSAAGLLIEGNDFYVTDAYRIPSDLGEFAVTENGIDLKHGSNDPNDPVRIRGNRFWGYRYTGSPIAGRSNGACLTIHRFAENLVIEGNVFFDAPICWFVNVRHIDQDASSRNILFKGNYVHGIRVHSMRDTGEIVWGATPETYDSNIFSSSTTLAAHTPAPATKLVGNHAIDTPLGQLATEWATGANSTSTQAYGLHVELKRLTGSEWVCLRRATLRAHLCVLQLPVGGLRPEVVS